ncbi:hypothetical protein HMPREF1582_00833 [Gardnerella vaginalis JCP8151A]|nr:hypothetical protein HMPREF1582_00833 [Gardnerella vaginalis JCP8151A]
MRIPPIRIILVCHNTCTEILERKYLSENAEVEKMLAAPNVRLKL